MCLPFFSSLVRSEEFNIRNFVFLDIHLTLVKLTTFFSVLITIFKTRTIYC